MSPPPHIACSTLITAHKRSLRRLCFYTCLSFCPQGGGVCLSACWDTIPHRSRHPPGSRLPRADSPGADSPPSQSRHPPEADSPPRSIHPLGAVHAGRYGQKGGRYASYWNAILLNIQFSTEYLLPTFMNIFCHVYAGWITSVSHQSLTFALLCLKVWDVTVKYISIT